MKIKLGIWLSIFILVISIFVFSFRRTSFNRSGPVLNVYNFGDFIDEKVLGMFSDETGIKINYDTFATSEDAYAKIKNGGTNYDVVIISDYMIERMANEDLLSPLDFSIIKNYSYVMPRFKNLSFDPTNKFSVPYVWGSVGILYNKKFVSKPTSWNVLWEKNFANQIFMYDNQRDSIGIALKKLGYSLNTRDVKKLLEAKNELITQKKLVQAYLSDAIKDKMISNEGFLAVAYSGDALFCQKENPDLDYIIPQEGSNIWFDSAVILKSSQNKKAANLFVNFLCRPDVAFLNTNYIGYSTVNSKAFELLPDAIKNNKIYWPWPDQLAKCEIYCDLGKSIRQYDIIWTEVLADASK